MVRSAGQDNTVEKKTPFHTQAPSRRLPLSSKYLASSLDSSSPPEKTAPPSLQQQQSVNISDTESAAEASGSGPASAVRARPRLPLTLPTLYEIEVDLAEDEDEDSALSDASMQGSTATLPDSVFEHRVLHGRTYQVSETTGYWAPVDEQQKESMDIFHHVMESVLGNRLTLVPLASDDDFAGSVLDIGTGTGIWAVDMADQFPRSTVIGTDISPMQPSSVPPNCCFVIDDCQLEWTWPADEFDLIHMRGLAGSIADWPALYGRAFEHTRPGGWVEAVEHSASMLSDRVHIGDGHPFAAWRNMLCAGGDSAGRSFRIADGHTMRQYFEQAGFVDVVERKVRVPLHGWPQDRELRTAGYFAQVALNKGLEGHGTYIMTEVLGWSYEEAMALIAAVRAEVAKKSNCAYYLACVVYGRKPDASDQQHSDREAGPSTWIARAGRVGY